MRAVWVAALVAVIVGELLPGTSAPMRWINSTGISDKALHYGAYIVLAGIPVFNFARPAGVISALSMILFGVALEFAQKVVPGRGFQMADILANTLGVLTGIAAGWAGRRFTTETWRNRGLAG